MRWKTLLFSFILFTLTACGSDSSAPTNPPSTSPPATNVPAQVVDPNAECPDFVEEALTATDGACEITGRNQACYGNAMVELNPDSEPTNLKFTEQGDIINVVDIQRLRLEPLNIQEQIWGVVLMRLQANLSDTTPGENVTFLMFGDVELENRSTDETTNINSFFFASGIGDGACNSAPESGLLIQTPEGVGRVELTINAVEISIGSTAYIQAQPDADMTVNVIEGQADITAQGETQTVNAGNRTKIGLDADGVAQSPPSPPEPYNAQPLQRLPIRNLPRPITITETVQAVDFTPIGFEVSDSIETDGEIDVYEFEGVAGQRIYVDALSAPTGPQWALFFERPENADLTQENETRVSAIPLLDRDLGYFELAETGTYQIVVRENNETYGDYAFKVWDVPSPEQMELVPVPDMPEALLGMGKGTIETPGVSDEYMLEVSAGQTLYFDGVTSDSNIKWNIYGADDEVFVPLDYDVNRNLNSITFETAGVYTIRVFGYEDTIGMYQFQVWDVPPTEEFELIEMDNPALIGVGSGEIDTPGVVDEYTLEVSAGQVVYFDGVESASGVKWNIYDEENNPLIDLDYDVNRNLGAILFDGAGTYTIRVWGYEDATGLYTFQLWDVPPVNMLELTILTDADEQIIGVGSGEIETPGVINEYTLDVSEGQIIYFDGVESASGVKWNIYDNENIPLIDLDYDANRNLGAIPFERAGTYTIRVWGYEDTTGTYSFQLWDVPPVNMLEMTIPIDADERVIGMGSSEIETPGVVDEYMLEVSAGQVIYFDGVESSFGVKWNIYDAENTPLINVDYDANRNLGAIPFEDAGTYTIRVWGYEDTTGTYSFQLWDVPPVTIAEISVPGRGSGDIETPGVVDEYVLVVSAGETIYFDGVESGSNIKWNVYDSEDEKLVSLDYDVSRDLETITFDTAGTYTIRVWGYEDTVGNYSFELRAEE